jgi:hypothetical protein
MRPQDIEKISQNVAGAFTGAGSTPRAGCGAFSNPEVYSCFEGYSCSAGYECGDLGNFTCPEGDFGCLSGFFCATDYTADLGD